MTDVAIVGMAALFPGAADLATYWHNIVTGIDAVTEVPATRWDASYYDPEAWARPVSNRFYCRRGGFVDDVVRFDATEFGIMPIAVEGAEPDQLLALKVAAAAVADAGGEDRIGDRRRVGVILGRGGYLTAGAARLYQRVRAGAQLVASLRELLPGLSGDQLDRVAEDFQARLGPERPEASIGLVPNLAASRIANRIDLEGPAYTVDAACASSLLAVDHAVAELDRGRCDMVVAGGVHVCDDLTLWSVFSQLRALSPSQQIRPFDRRADGILIGEGVGMVVLKRLTDADAAGDRVYAVIKGTGVASDGRDTSLMRPRVEGQVLALERAWAASRLDPTAPGAIGLVEAHGTATPIGDEAELTTLRRVFGSIGTPIGIGSVKSMIGHAMPAAGMAGLIKAALAVHHRVLPPTLHCEEPHPALAGGRFQPVDQATPWEESGDGRGRRVVVNAFGFGGINAHIVLQPPSSPEHGANSGAFPPHIASQPPRQRVLLVAGASDTELGTQLALEDAVLLARDDIRRLPDAGPWRLAIVDPTPTRLQLARKVVARGRPWRGRNDVWFTATPLLAGDTAKIAFLFPGIEQVFNPRVEGVAAQFHLSEPALPTADSIGAKSVATVALGRLLDGALRRMGVIPDVVAGHSIGEWNAMIAAGMHEPADIEAVVAAFDEDSVEVPGLVFAALGCGADQAEGAIAGLDRIEVTHDNCPNQSIICGEEASIMLALERLRTSGVTGQMLNFRSGFHSSMVEPYLGPVARHLGNLVLRPAEISIWSATIADAYPADLGEVRTLCRRHLLEPVRFGPMVQRLHDDGVRAFVQVGSGSLAGFVDDALRDRDQLVVSACTSKNRGLDQLLRVGAALWVEGASPRLSKLAASEGGGQALRLGTPLVHFATDTAPLVLGAAPDDQPRRLPLPAAGEANPVLREMRALLADTEAAADAVLKCWLPPAESKHAAESKQATTIRVVSLDTMPYLQDHCFYRQADGWGEMADRFPVVPMTTMLEMMMDAARPLAGSRTVVGLTAVRALRWLAPTEPVNLTIKASADADGNIEVSLDGFARGTVLVADRFPSPPRGRAESFTGERPANAEDLYRDRWLFHGPAFQGVTAIGAYADEGSPTPGIQGRLVSLAAPGALLDSAGQLLGFWMQAAMTANKLGFPASIERLELFGPHPPCGESLECRVWIRSVTATLVTADLEVGRADGTVWARISGWSDHRFLTDEAIDPVLRWPEKNRIAEAQPGGWFLLHDRWADPANRELVMRRYLCGRERKAYEQHNPRGRHAWLLGRIAAKDALRQWLWDRGAGPLYPAQFDVDNEAGGLPIVRGLPDGPRISIAHRGEYAVALVGDGVGIDVEVVEERSAEFEATAYTEAEGDLIAGFGPRRAEMLTRFWVGKEAVSKAVGTGLGGRPRRFEITAVVGSQLLVAAFDHGSHWWVDTTIVRGADGAKVYAVGWTTTSLVPAGAVAATALTFSPGQP